MLVDFDCKLWYSKLGPSILPASDCTFWVLAGITSLLSQVKDHCTLIILFFWISRWRPLFFGEPSDTVSIFNLEKCNSRPFIVTPWVKFLITPSMFRPPIKKRGLNILSFKCLLEVFRFFFTYFTIRFLINWRYRYFVGHLKLSVIL